MSVNRYPSTCIDHEVRLFQPVLLCTVKFRHYILSGVSPLKLGCKTREIIPSFLLLRLLRISVPLLIINLWACTKI